MRFDQALIMQEDISEQRVKLDASFDEKLAALRQVYEQRKTNLEKSYAQANHVITTESPALTDPKVHLGSQAVRIVGDAALAGRDFEHCCLQAATNLARTQGQSLGHYSYCTVTRGAIHGLFQVLPFGGKAQANDIPLFRIEGTPEVAHKILTGSQLPSNVIEAASYFVYHLPALFKLGWRWEDTVVRSSDLFAGDPNIAQMLTQ